jgi:surface antigen
MLYGLRMESNVRPVTAISMSAIIAAVVQASAADHRHGERANLCPVRAALGVALTHDIVCGDQSDAADAFRASLNGEIGRFYPWYHGDHYGTFLITREYRDAGIVCRDFHAVSYREGYRFSDDGTACRNGDGAWQTR